MRRASLRAGTNTETNGTGSDGANCLGRGATNSRQLSTMFNVTNAKNAVTKRW